MAYIRDRCQRWKILLLKAGTEMLPSRVIPPITYCQTLTFSDPLSTNHVRMFQRRNLSFPFLQL